MGVQFQMIDRRTAIANGLVEGAYIEKVMAGSPANKAGLKEEDVIMKIDGVRVSGTDEQSIAKMLLEKNVGQKIQVAHRRDDSRENDISDA